MGSIGVSRPDSANRKLFREFQPMSSSHLIYEILYVINEEVPSLETGGSQIKYHVVEEKPAGIVQQFCVSRDVQRL